MQLTQSIHVLLVELFDEASHVHHLCFGYYVRQDRILGFLQTYIEVSGGLREEGRGRYV